MANTNEKAVIKITLTDKSYAIQYEGGSHSIIMAIVVTILDLRRQMDIPLKKLLKGISKSATSTQIELKNHFEG